MKVKKLSPLSFPIQKKFDFLRRMRHTPSNLKNYSPVSCDATRDGRCDALLCVTLSSTPSNATLCTIYQPLTSYFLGKICFCIQKRTFKFVR